MTDRNNNDFNNEKNNDNMEYKTRHELYHRKNDKTKRRKKWRIIFFILAVLLVIGGVYAYKKYSNARNAANEIYSSTEVKKARNVSTALKEKRPISILLMGTDTGALGRNFKGRTDTMIICVLNPKDKKMTLVSLPRDAEVAVYGYEDYFPSKINSAYKYGGSASAVKTVQKFLNVPIDFYATINMGGLEKLIDAVGGITLKPTLSFSYDGYSFKKDVSTEMKGKKALTYVRMRYDDPRGDYGRQARQRQVLMELAFKGSDLTSLANQEFLNTISKQMKTDLTFDDIWTLGTTYRVATHGMDSDYLQGTSKNINGESFEVVSTSEKQRITNKLRKALGLSKDNTGNTLSKNDTVNTTAYDDTSDNDNGEE